MNILKLMAYYEPEQYSDLYIDRDLDEAFIKSGMNVFISTPSPTRGISDVEYKENKRLKSEVSDHKTILRFAMFREGRNPLFRAIRYLVSNVVQYFIGAGYKDINILYAVSTPPTQGFMCALVKKRLKVPFIYNLQDIFPDTLVNAGLTRRGSFLWRIGTLIERYTYKNADRIIVISEDCRKNILEKGVPPEKIEVIPNWVDTEQIVPISRGNNLLFDELRLDRALFYITYAGNLGESQNIDAIFKAAGVLKELPNIAFVIFGGGVNYARYSDMIHENGIGNIRLFPMQPHDRLSEVYSLGNMSLVPCKKGCGSASMPSKIWNIMSCGTPVLACFDTDSSLNRILAENACGFCVAPDDLPGLTEIIAEYSKKTDDLARMGENGRNYVMNHLSKEKSISPYIRLVNSV